jgi:hypothetical protein
MALWQVAIHWPLDVIKLLHLLLEIFFRTAILASLVVFAYRLLQTAWGVLRFLVQTLVQKVGGSSSADYAGPTNQSV